MDYPVSGRSPDVATAVVSHSVDGSGRAVPAGTLTAATVTVAAGASLSGAVDCRGYVPTSVLLPADLRGLATITALMTSFDGATYVTRLADDASALDEIDVTGRESSQLPLPVFYGRFNWLKLQFGEEADQAVALTVGLEPAT